MDMLILMGGFAVLHLGLALRVEILGWRRNAGGRRAAKEHTHETRQVLQELAGLARFDLFGIGSNRPGVLLDALRDAS